MACLLGHKWDGCICTKCGKKRDEQHNWNGCMCSKCGSKRNEGHNYVNYPEKCEDICSVCNEVRASHDFSGSTCKACGKTVLLTDEERKMVGPLEALIFLRGKIDTGIGNASLIDTLIKFDNNSATVDDIKIVVNTVYIFRDTICNDDPQSSAMFGDNRKQICNGLLERYKDFIVE